MRAQVTSNTIFFLLSDSHGRCTHTTRGCRSDNHSNYASYVIFKYVRARRIRANARFSRARPAGFSKISVRSNGGVGRLRSAFRRTVGRDERDFGGASELAQLYGAVGRDQSRKFAGGGGLSQTFFFYVIIQSTFFPWTWTFY